MFISFLIIRQLKDLINEMKSSCNPSSKQTLTISLENNIEQFRIEASSNNFENLLTINIDNFKLSNNECPPSKF